MNDEKCVKCDSHNISKQSFVNYWGQKYIVVNCQDCDSLYSLEDKMYDVDGLIRLDKAIEYELSSLEKIKHEYDQYENGDMLWLYEIINRFGSVLVCKNGNGSKFAPDWKYRAKALAHIFMSEIDKIDCLDQ